MEKSLRMKTKVTERGVIVPKKFLKDIKEVKVRKDNSVILVVPVTEDPIFTLGSPADCGRDYRCV
jgi:hypothetical protein